MTCDSQKISLVLWVMATFLFAACGAEQEWEDTPQGHVGVPPARPAAPGKPQQAGDNVRIRAGLVDAREARAERARGSMPGQDLYAPLTLGGGGGGEGEGEGEGELGDGAWEIPTGNGNAPGPITRIIRAPGGGYAAVVDGSVWLWDGATTWTSLGSPGFTKHTVLPDNAVCYGESFFTPGNGGVVDIAVAGNVLWATGGFGYFYTVTKHPVPGGPVDANGCGINLGVINEVKRFLGYLNLNGNNQYDCTSPTDCSWSPHYPVPEGILPGECGPGSIENCDDVGRGTALLFVEGGNPTSGLYVATDGLRYASDLFGDLPAHTFVRHQPRNYMVGHANEGRINTEVGVDFNGQALAFGKLQGVPKIVVGGRLWQPDAAGLGHCLEAPVLSTFGLAAWSGALGADAGSWSSVAGGIKQDADYQNCNPLCAGYTDPPPELCSLFVPSYVQSLAFSGDDLYVSGKFQHVFNKVNGASVEMESHGFARIRNNEWENLADLDCLECGFGAGGVGVAPTRLVSSATSVYMIGSGPPENFARRKKSSMSNSVLAWTNESWRTLAGGTTGSVNDAVLESPDSPASPLLVVGTFDSVGHYDHSNSGEIPQDDVLYAGGLATWNPIAGPACGGDINNDHTVNGTDLATVLSGWGSPSGDLNGDGTTDGSDLATLLSGWGTCP